MTTEAAKAAKARYDAKTARYISLKLNRNTDADIIARLDQQESIQAYIKSLIRRDMKGANTMKYRINPDYIDLWGDEANENTILTIEQIEDITRGWDKTPDDVMDQLIPVDDDE